MGDFLRMVGRSCGMKDAEMLVHGTDSTRQWTLGLARAWTCSTLVVVLGLELTLSGCANVPRSEVDRYRYQLLEQEQIIEAQEEQIHELTRESSLALSRQVLLQRECEELANEIDEIEARAVLPVRIGGADVTLDCLTLPYCDSGSTRWRQVLTETNGVGVTFTHCLVFYRLRRGNDWSAPRGVSYYDETVSPLAWPMKLSPNERRETGGRISGCFSEERLYTVAYFGRDAVGNDVVATGTFMANERN